MNIFHPPRSHFMKESTNNKKDNNNFVGMELWTYIFSHCSYFHYKNQAARVISDYVLTPSPNGGEPSSAADTASSAKGRELAMSLAPPMSSL